MRFIRVHGRIVPIKDKGESQASADKKAVINRAQGLAKQASSPATINKPSFDRSTAFKTTAALTALTVGTNHIAHVASALRMRKTAAVAATLTEVLPWANLGHQIGSSYRASKSNSNVSGIGEFLRHRAVNLGVGVGAGLISKAAFQPTVKALIHGKEGFYKGVNAAYKAAKPHTSAFRDYRTFLRAKKVPNYKPVMGLLK